MFAHLFYAQEAPVKLYVMHLTLCCGLWDANSSHRLLKTKAHNLVTMSNLQVIVLDEHVTLLCPQAIHTKYSPTPTITAEQAKAAALAANPGATASSVGLDDENGCLVYGVQLSNGADVKVDAGNGQVVHTEAAGTDDGLEGGHLEGVETEPVG